MPKKLHKIDLMEILDGLVRSDIFEGFDEDTSIERKALIGAALAQIGADITAEAKRDSMHFYRGIKSSQNEGRVKVQYVPAKQPDNLNTDKIKEDFPLADFPQYWKKGNNKEHIKFTIGPRPAADEVAADAADAAAAQPAPLDFMPGPDNSHRDEDGILWSGPAPTDPNHRELMDAAEAELEASGFTPNPLYIDPATEIAAEELESQLLDDDFNPELAAELRLQWELETADPDCEYCSPESQCYVCAERNAALKHSELRRQLYKDCEQKALDAGNDPQRVAKAVGLAQNPGGMQRAKEKYLTNALSCQCPDGRNPQRKCKHQLAYIMRHNVQAQLDAVKAPVLA